MENKIPTAQDMRVKSLRCGTTPLKELPLYMECVKRLQESTGHSGMARVILGVSTDEFQDIRIKKGEDVTTVRRVCDVLEEAGYSVSYESGPASGFTNHDTLRICWSADVFENRSKLNK